MIAELVNSYDYVFIYCLYFPGDEQLLVSKLCLIMYMNVVYYK